MPIATVTVAGKADPEMGKKRGRIKSQDGMLFQADPLFLSQVNVGGTYDVTFKDDEWKGAKYRVVEGIAPSIGQAPIPRATAQAQAHLMPSSPQPDERSIDIAVLALTKEWVSRIPVGDEGALVHALKVARRAWLTSKLRPDSKIETGKQSVADEMNDALPDF